MATDPLPHSLFQPRFNTFRRSLITVNKEYTLNMIETIIRNFYIESLEVDAKSIGPSIRRRRNSKYVCLASTNRKRDKYDSLFVE